MSILLGLSSNRLVRKNDRGKLKCPFIALMLLPKIILNVQFNNRNSIPQNDMSSVQ